MSEEKPKQYTTDEVRAELKSICSSLIDGSESTAKDRTISLYENVLSSLIREAGMTGQLAREALKASAIRRNWPTR